MLPKILLFNIEKIKYRNLFVYQKLKFKIKRFYFHNNLKKGYIFGLHAHKKLKQIYIDPIIEEKMPEKKGRSINWNEYKNMIR